jgi:putative redox protein
MKKTKIKWTGGMQFVGQGESGHAVVMDAGTDHGGADSATRPGELPLLALGGCTGIDVVTILRKMKITLDSMDILIEAETASTHPKVWKEIHVKYFIRGDVPEKKLRRAITLSHEKYCSVGAVLGATAKMRFEYEVTCPSHTYSGVAHP